MKMKLFICAILIFSFTSGANAPSQSVDSAVVNMDSLYLDQLAKKYMDSVAREDHKQIDSMAIVIDSIKQETFKRMVLGRIDVWGPLLPRRDTLKWWYWKYPNGEMKFIKTTKH